MNDKAWWVRINSANALANFGDEGITALESISLEEDKFAYETAQTVLKIRKNMQRN
jgi:HEAT repeat protein